MSELRKYRRYRHRSTAEGCKKETDETQEEAGGFNYPLVLCLSSPNKRVSVGGCYQHHAECSICF